MSLKKFWKVSILSIIAVFMLAACGSKEETTGGSSEKGLEKIKDKDKIVFGVKNDTRLFGLKNTSTMTITEERKKEVDFTDVYFEAGQSLLVKKGSKIKSIDDLKAGTKVLAVKGSTSAINIAEKAPDAEVLQYENYAEAFTALKSGQGDALTTDDAILYGMVAEDPSYELVGGQFTEEPYGIAVKKGNTELVDELNKALKTIKDNGTYDEILNKWIENK